MQHRQIEPPPIFGEVPSLIPVLQALRTRMTDSQSQEREVFQDAQALQHALTRRLDDHGEARLENQQSMLMHGIKNALAGILASAELLRANDLTPAERDEVFDMIRSDIEKIIALIEECQPLAEEQPSRRPWQPHSLTALIQEIRMLVERDLAHQGIVIATDLQYTGLVEMDRVQMKHAVLNLLYNARDAMPRGGTVTILTRLVEEMVQVEIIDTGCGISPDVQAQMLDPGVTKGKPQGSGLGLTIVKQILEQHHGHCEVESVVSQGTTVRLSIPRAQGM
ncbi:hypothetical protein GF339_02330 [candidate division KSB3 bacterium]|uniref:histidine kinase n=1 Tax=candidate division KSB3 bacterium TaxID=2044937 RepID=A0A9D5JSG0_9BACT|nr:hypothetical protein [candidate division KSB3 bacterium]MBD3323390.1 hypothetical protein [candidate division KSB3 bacterium]